jgi:hypothetical protein
MRSGESPIYQFYQALFVNHMFKPFPEWIATTLVPSVEIGRGDEPGHTTCSLSDFRQGNRISGHGQSAAEIGIIPGGAFELSAPGSFGSLLSHDVLRHVTRDREVGTVVSSVSVLVFVHDDIQTPVEALFCRLKRTDHRAETLGGHGGAEQIIPAALGADS